MTATRKVLFGVVLVSPLLLFGLWVYGRLECYCIFYPSIDTRFAPGYSDSAFSSVSTGMTSQAVSQKLGAPFYTYTNRDDTVCWGYSDDGKCWWGDFAWLGREIAFRDGRVVQVLKHVYED